LSLCSDHRWGDDPIHCALDLRFVAVVAGPAPAHLFAMQDILETLRDYYRQAAVRARMLEFLGADEAGDFTAEYITADTPALAERTPLLPWELSAQLDAGRDICRSLADRDSLIAHLDIEYVNFDFPADAYLDPARAFALQEPVELTVKRVLGHYGIEALHILSGRGHHFVWRVSRASKVFARLAETGRPTLTHDSLMLRRRDGLDAPSITCAFAGLGLLMEFVARLVIEMSASETVIPVEMTAVEVAPSRRGRELISIDLSEYADPLPMRTIRVPYSGYLKPWQQTYAVGAGNLPRIGPIIFVTLDAADLRHGIAAMRDPKLAAALARESSAIIPDQTNGSEHLLHHYLGSDLKKMHDLFYTAQHDDPRRWPETYDHTPLDYLPAGAREALRRPNDLLLRPVGMKNVTNALLDRGWHPRHIAGLIRSKFERDHAWGEEWKDYSPALRADYYTRMFAGERTSVGTEAGEIAGAEHLPGLHWPVPRPPEPLEV
jgi:hypothetical protein